ncbi:Acyl-[acyl-carrier-protein]--UDP-N-acetylglucosamine O-acyltransferase [Commensalibacter sp. Nvir]|uniref:acyl-ACP--UDP-N-acetylglucosamine O-acyltransferase n=1 Tax=Commensalibacter sp. Nvir TaxID=3069817 RepID=UPI002D3AAD5A|nr:Acyl-[acyl-carrier-protein]--UDP-N-acetylglucosamine O-acyltransferase [Commensalibacter sp. Nvir]
MEKTPKKIEPIKKSIKNNQIHPSAIIHPNAQLENNVFVGPWCMIGENVVIKEGVKLIANVIVEGHTILGKNSIYYPYTTIGLAPQDLKYEGEPTRCIIGDRSIVREQVTIHRGTGSSGITQIGTDCLIMVNTHVAHDCFIGNRVILVNNVVLGGHVHIDNDARVMGSAAIHQFVRIGKGALVGGVTGVESDVIPYGSVIGNRAKLVGMHWIWLKRNGVDSSELNILRNVYRMLFPKDDGNNKIFEDRIQSVKKKYADVTKVQEIIHFVEQPSRRGLVKVGRSISPLEAD